MFTVLSCRERERERAGRGPHITPERRMAV